MKNIIVLGGGYGGVTVINELFDGYIPDDYQVTLVDRMPFQGLKTEYYALASGTVSDVEIRNAFPSFSELNIHYGEVHEINVQQKSILFEDGEALSYDILIIALGCTDKYHQIPGADMHTCSIQSLYSARETYTKINNLCPHSQVTVVGGGLSGVEIAAELREGRPDLNVRIMDRGSCVLSPFPKKLQKYVAEWFIKNEVEIISHASISEVYEDGLLNKDQEISTHLTVWTAGIQPVAVVQKMNFPKDPTGRILTNEFHQLPEHDDTYIIGDCASSSFAPSAQLAEAQGKQVVEVLRALWKNETPTLGQIKLKGVLGSLGKKSGFGMMGKKTVMIGKVPRLLKSGVLWMSKRHFG
ncbi:NAD(P)/FAD-dependent oxidoreductase [Longirhabdus pacifica]|uniref:NAD(P)/FAD-dependent oxidoreductase n=1 Tax=Longirhabdus pacifica TaxID=2305227 RepID=UPI0010089919|nr:FAD-dependent oxidoreductase [Longirhabdus pacifica]